MKKFLLAFLMLIPMLAWAAPMQVDGIWYNIDVETKIAEVTDRNGGTRNGGNSYSGDIVIPESISINSIVYTVLAIGRNAFFVCTDLTSVTIPNSVINIGNGAFRGCTGLKSIDIPNSVMVIGDDVFRDCTGLTSVTIPNSTFVVGEGAFRDCPGLKSITIGSSMMNIYDLAFASCKNLETVTCLAEEVPSTLANAFQDSNIEGATLCVPAQSVAAYRSADPWKNFGKIEATEETAIALTQIDERHGNAEYYKPNGVKVDKPTLPGIYLMKKNGKTKMTMVSRL